jgi:hypothetical protein
VLLLKIGLCNLTGCKNQNSHITGCCSIEKLFLNNPGNLAFVELMLLCSFQCHLEVELYHYLQYNLIKALITGTN